MSTIPFCVALVLTLAWVGASLRYYEKLIDASWPRIWAWTGVAVALCAIMIVAASTAVRADIASTYPNGGPRACPGRYHGHTVAHRTLPCGTRRKFTHAGRTIIATVNDRGPFKPGRHWDFPTRDALALGFNDGLVYVRVERP